jgi:hypothetical protein
MLLGVGSGLLPAVLAILPASLVLILLGLLAALLLGAFVKGGGQILKGPDKMNTEVTFRFVGFFDGFGDVFDGGGEAFKGGMDTLEAGRDALEEFQLGIAVSVVLGGAHKDGFS